MRVNSLCRLLLKAGTRQSLTNTVDAFVDMMGKLECVDLVPYSRVRSSARFQAGPSVGVNPSSGPAHHDLIASAVGFPDVMTPFNPLPYLSKASRAAYRNPDSLLKPEEEWGPVAAPYPAPKDQLIALVHRWDRVGRLALFPSTGPDAPAAD